MILGGLSVKTAFTAVNVGKMEFNTLAKERIWVRNLLISKRSSSKYACALIKFGRPIQGYFQGYIPTIREGFNKKIESITAVKPSGGVNRLAVVMI